MLDPWIIEEIIRREREEQRRIEQERRIELPLQNPPRYHDSDQPKPAPSEDHNRGVTTFDI